MLKNIHISNFALAHNLNIAFGEGLNIITGETGTGKSILVGAISAVLGGRVFTEVVRTGEEKALIDAVFDISRLKMVKKILQEKGLDQNEELFLRREISVKGSTRAFVNDIPVTVTTLSEIGDLLVDIHGQNEHQSLLRRETHRYFLDAFGQLAPHLEQVEQDFENLKKAEIKLKELEKRKKALEEKYELFAFQADEIEKANLKADEEEKLEAERKILVNAEKIFSLTAQLNEITNGNAETSLLDSMGQALHLLRELTEFSDDLNPIFQEFSSAKIIVEETARSVEEFQSKIEFDPLRLEEIEQRLAAIAGLKKKYGNSVDEVLAHLGRIKTDLQLKENFEFELGKLQKEHEKTRQRYEQTARDLSEARKKAAAKLETEVIALLLQIGMPKTRFRVNMEWQEETDGVFRQDGKNFFGDERGVDQIEFYISPNPGEEFKPLIKIASGGEISRIMLALKNILAEIDHIPLLIFDEIDAGVSGRVALAVGKSIRKLADSHQIISITHLPQIASFGNSHFRVEKFVEKGRTFTSVVSLEHDRRVEEIARLIAGEQISEAILQSARQLLEEAGNGQAIPPG